MTKYSLPQTIDNEQGEILTFKTIVNEAGEDRVLIEAEVAPNCGPVMHTHFKQDEYLSVKQGKLGYQFLGKEARYLTKGEGILFQRGAPHRFWNAGEDPLLIEGWVQPVNSIIFYLSTLYEAQKIAGKVAPEPFLGAYLVTRYRSEYDVHEIPGFVKKIIMPATVFVGQLLGKYQSLKRAPLPLK